MNRTNARPRVRFRISITSCPAAIANSGDRGSGIRGGRYRSACRAKSNSDGSRISVGVGDAESAADVVEAAVDGQRRRRQHRRVHPVEQQLADDAGHVDGRRAQEDPLAAKLDEVDVGRDRAARSRNLSSVRISSGPPRERRGSPRSDPRRRRRCISRRPGAAPGQQRQRRLDEVECAGEIRRPARSRSSSELAVARTRSSPAHASAGAVRECELGEERRARRSRSLSSAFANDSRSVRLSTAPDATSRSTSRARSSTPVVADGEAEVLRRDVLELMRLVDDGQVARRNHLADRRSAAPPRPRTADGD